MSETKRIRKTLVGRIVTDTADKTVSVQVKRSYRHRLYKKTITASKNYLAHDEKNEYKIGEVVKIEECAPLSKRKTWFVKERVATGRKS
ncbi:30S ribosomal protein S17 [bacterium]|nr:30S ribosomal protein S17 [bacterium]